MKIVVSKEKLMFALRKVLSVVSSRTTLPVLNNILMEASEGQLILTTTDLEVCISTQVDAEVLEAGVTTVPAKKFGQIIGALPTGEVTLESDEQQLTSIACKNSFFRIVGLDANEFPRENQVEDTWKFTLPCQEFRKNLAKVYYASSTDETRHVLNGVLLSLREGILTIAATDGRRLALVEKPLDGEEMPDGDVILPPKVVNELQRSLDSEGNIVIELSASRAIFSFGDSVMTSKLVEGSYPNYRLVIPEGFTRSAVIPRDLFATVLNRVSMVIGDSSTSVHLKLENATMTVSATNAELGESQEPLEISYEGEDIQISFNPVFLADPFKHMEVDQLVMQFNDEFSPVAISGDEGFLYIIMPMRS
jgi:DNA polymerase-3 subunit beta